ncbi:MAG: methyltransferase domain-containing protein [Hyphomicrobiales bacterium]|nr:methyltransferase domain-containing protein [Hyphomicrobiales bacterium]
MFDHHQHQLRLARAKQRFEPGNDFLLTRCVEDMIERLSAVNMTFEKAVLLFGRSDGTADLLRQCAQIETLHRVEEASHQGASDHLATPELLGLPDQSADLIIAPLTLHWSNDLPGTLIQIKRVLKPNGLLLANLPGPETLQELRHCMLQAESEISGGAANRVDAFTDIRDAGGLLQRAGFAIPVVDREAVTVRYDSVFALVRDLRAFGATSHMQSSPKPALTRDIIARMAQIYAEQFADPDGRIRATFDIISLSGWAPHESQQKPLRPGSAKTRLADALNVDEIKLKD